MLSKNLDKITKCLYGDNTKSSDRPFINFVLEKIEEFWIKSKEEKSKNTENNENKKETKKYKNVFIIEAPTGYGKTSISATIALYGLLNNDQFKTIISYPLRTLLEDQYNTFYNGKYSNGGLSKIYFSKKDSSSLLQKYHLISKRYMHNPYSRYLIKPITLTTVDTLSLTIFGIPPEDISKVAKKYEYSGYGSMGHYLFAWSSIALSNIVLDEVHLISDQTKSLTFLIFLIKFAIEMDLLLVLMSATIPNALLKVISSQLDQDEKNRTLIIFYSSNNNNIVEKNETGIDTIVYENWINDNFVRERRRKKSNENEGKNYTIELLDILVSDYENKKDQKEKIITTLLNKLKEKENNNYNRVIVIFNTVNDAIKFYEKIKNDNDIINRFKDNIILLHSRFTENDRKVLFKKVKELKENKNSTYLIIATQVIEAGIDISSDLMITELCPANSLIQRLGRFLRYPKERFGKIIIWYRANENKEPLITNIEFLRTNKENLKNDIKTKEEVKIGLDYLKEFAEKDQKLQETKQKLEEKIAIEICKKLKIDEKYKSKIKLDFKEKLNDYRVIQVLYTVYDYLLVYKTWSYLKHHINNLNIHLPDVPINNNSNEIGYRELLNEVYSEGYFQYDKESINEFKGIFMNLENASILALEKFFDLEGSFVRDSLLIPVLIKTKKSELKQLKKEFKNENSELWNKCSINRKGKKVFVISKFIQQYFVPLEYNTFKTMIQGKDNNEPIVKEVYVLQNKIKSKTNNNKIKIGIKYYKLKDMSFLLRNEVNLIKYMIINDVIGFILISDKLSYDSEKGLVKGDEK